MERGPRLYGYGADSNSTRRLLRYISNTYGPVASFTGTPETRNWILTINATHFNESARPATLPVSPFVSTNSKFYKFYNK